MPHNGQNRTLIVSHGTQHASVDLTENVINQNPLDTRISEFRGEDVADLQAACAQRSFHAPHDEKPPIARTQANMSDHLCPIAQLPAEILMLIFSVFIDSNIRQHKAQPYEPYINHANIISGVCTHWRSIALGTRPLWSYIDFRRVRDLEHTTVLLDRSRGVPLDAIIASFTRDSEWSPSSVVHRLRCLKSIHYYCSYVKLAEQWLLEWCKNGTPTILTTLILSPWAEGGLVFPSDSKEPPRERLDELLSSVKTVFLRNVGVDWGRVMFRNLATLKLISMSRLPIEPIVNILLASPALECLHLRNLGIDWGSTTTLQSIPLPWIHTLELSRMRTEAMCLFSAALVPGSRDLTLKMIPPEEDPENPMPEFKESLLMLFNRSNIKAFYLDGTTILKWIITATPNLEILVLNDVEIDSNICNAIAPPLDDSIEPLLGFGSTPWPKLHTFHAASCSFTDIAGFKRVLSTCPIRELKIDINRASTEEVHEGCETWAGLGVNFSTECQDWTFESVTTVSTDL
ncbi:hypothetical protein BDV93DRAFT_608888 [Ceratobasidium sp. AG-I]|nr:hypothetical protein BDV93DRAFT_608888 [Ceratobasidium sp. AG-I]